MSLSITESITVTVHLCFSVGKQTSRHVQANILYSHATSIPPFVVSFLVVDVGGVFAYASELNSCRIFKNTFEPFCKHHRNIVFWEQSVCVKLKSQTAFGFDSYPKITA